MQADMTPLSVDVAIVGGGFSGLSVAWYLQQGAETRGLPVSYSVLESAGRWGGKVLTECVDGYGDVPFILEGGPDSFFTQKPWAEQLAIELGLGDRLLGTNDQMRRIFVVNKGRSTPLPDGVLLIVPTRFKPFVLSPLISLPGKLRMGMDLFIPPKRDGLDETLADFVRRRLGSEALDKIAEPLMSGIYNSEAERQSLLATFPRFRALEEKHGSLTRGMLASRRNGSHAASGSRRQSAFMSLVGGTGELVDGLISHLSGDLHLDTTVQAIGRSAGGYVLHVASGNALHARHVVLAIPAFTAADLLRELAPEPARIMSGIRYVSTGTVSLAYRECDIPEAMRGFGIVVPRSEKRPVNAVTWSSVKFDHRAPPGYALLRVFFGGSRSPRSMDLDDNALLDVVGSELRALMGIKATPLFHRVYRWPRSNAQYDVGHLDRVAAIEARLPNGLYPSGSPYRGVGLPDCARQGKETAERILTQLAGEP
jgi:oxygen-dependent protoporphyrinogen oxidase